MILLFMITLILKWNYESKVLPRDFHIIVFVYAYTQSFYSFIYIDIDIDIELDIDICMIYKKYFKSTVFI